MLGTMGPPHHKMNAIIFYKLRKLTLEHFGLHTLVYTFCFIPARSYGFHNDPCECGEVLRKRMWFTNEWGPSTSRVIQRKVPLQYVHRAPRLGPRRRALLLRHLLHCAPHVGNQRGRAPQSGVTSNLLETQGWSQINWCGFET